MQFFDTIPSAEEMLGTVTNNSEENTTMAKNTLPKTKAEFDAAIAAARAEGAKQAAAKSNPAPKATGAKVPTKSRKNESAEVKELRAELAEAEATIKANPSIRGDKARKRLRAKAHRTIKHAQFLISVMVAHPEYTKEQVKAAIRTASEEANGVDSSDYKAVYNAALSAALPGVVRYAA